MRGKNYDGLFGGSLMGRISALGMVICMLSGCVAMKTETVWYSPITIDTVTRGVRPAFVETFTEVENWKTTYKNTAVFKQYIETLYPGGNPSTGAKRYSDEELKQLATFVREAGLKCAFEFGALRWSPELYGPGSGKAYAMQEIEVLQRWVDAGGTVDYLTADHAVMWNVGLCVQGAKPMAKYVDDPDWRKVADEVVESLVMIQDAYPNAKLGMIESLGYFSVRGADGTMYHTTDPGSVYPIDFEEYISTLQAKLNAAGVELDHFHIDYNYHDCLHDARLTGRDGMDFNRVIGTEKIVQSQGLNSGIIITALDDYSPKGVSYAVEKGRASNADQRCRSAYTNTLEYLDGYRAAGGNPDTWIFQRWHPYPDIIGPESDPYTDMGLTKALIQRLQK
jgi:hypothetical protein